VLLIMVIIGLGALNRVAASIISSNSNNRHHHQKS
jgi:hypothetical protein